MFVIYHLDLHNINPEANIGVAKKAVCNPSVAHATHTDVDDLDHRNKNPVVA